MIASRQIAFGKAAGEAPPAYWGLCFTAEEDGSTVAMEAVGSAPAVSLETSYDGEIWEPFYVGDTSITLNRGERVYFKAGEGGNTRFAQSTAGNNKFVLETGRIFCSGNIMSLLNGAVESDTIPAAFCFYRFFNNCISIVSAPELPAKTLTRYCYSDMFMGCTNLAVVPKLPATTLSFRSYHYMFYGCSNLSEIDVAITAFDHTTNWLSGVSSTGTFRCPTALGTNETITRGVNACPEGWTVINTD